MRSKLIENIWVHFIDKQKIPTPSRLVPKVLMSLRHLYLEEELDHSPIIFIQIN